MRPSRLLGSLFASVICALSARAAAPAEFNIRDFGAVGNGKTLDTAAINQAIAAAANAGGGVVRFPAGTYLSFSIRLKSHLELHLDPGCILVAATPERDGGAYDAAEPNPWGDKQYQDYGHSHFQNSLIWGRNLEDISITGPGRIFGEGLLRANRRIGAGGPNGTAEVRPAANPAPGATGSGAPPANGALQLPPEGSGNKAIALENCRNVTLRDFSILQGGWLAVLAAGVDNFAIDNVRVDTNRDGFDIDNCRNTRISNCVVNAPNDDAIVLKSSYALGELRSCENITITGCQVSGYDVGSFLDGTYKATEAHAPDRDGPTGRIKFGTESNGGFKNIAISNCVFDRSRGFAIESVDGAIIENIAATNLVMRNVSSSPIFIRLGNRARGPEGTEIGSIRGITISHVIALNADGRYPIIIAGLPDHPIEDVRLDDIRVTSQGGLTLEQVAQQPADLVNTFFLRGPGLSGPRDAFNPPEQEKGYPEPSMFGLLPAYGLYARHVKSMFVRDLELSLLKADTRPAIVLNDVSAVEFNHLKAPHTEKASLFALRKVADFNVRQSVGMTDLQREQVTQESLP